MRTDMDRVLIERPRYRGGPRRRGRREPLDELPLREPMGSMNRWGTKGFTDLLGPLKRFLSSRAGRPWDEVYSEIRAVIDGRGRLQQHLLDHLLGMVAIRVERVDGVLIDLGDWGPRPVFSGRWRSSYYVDPDTGRLERAPNLPRKRRR